MMVDRYRIGGRGIQLCLALVLLSVFWIGGTLLAGVGAGSRRLAALMDEQKNTYGWRTGHSKAFEDHPPAHFDGSAPSYYVPDGQRFLAHHAPFPPLPIPDHAEHLAICLVVRNQSIDMPEFFVHHYHHHGVRRFYVYDDGTVPQLVDKPYVDNWGIPDQHIDFTYVQPEDVLNRGRLQADLYTDCAVRARGKHKWVAFLDPDEFLEMRGENPPSLIDFLKEYEKDDEVGAVAVHWLNHNSDDVIEKHPGESRKVFKKCIGNTPLVEDPEENDSNVCGHGYNRNIKTFVRTDRFEAIENIHWVKVTNGHKEVTEHGDTVWTWCHKPITHDKWALHHYMTKSWEDWELKLGRHRYVGVCWSIGS